ncbi:MAG: hypothetical protein GY786_18960 [Proteobacteria bacterium]|nr:hypothetical protein [Pseudomonadota bacterium]
MKVHFKLLILLTFISLAGCSAQKTLLTKENYRASINEFSQSSPEKAIKAFPKGEREHFITTMEKAYLNLLQGKPEIEGLIKYVNIFEDRVRYKVSREVKSFFYVKTPEDYYASEHEVIWLHLLLSWGYSMKNEHESGCIEARKAAHLLNAPWSEEGHFDDALIRIILAGLWARCGSWEDAQIDFRRAWNLDSKLTWAKELADMDTPPKHLFIILGGVGPVPIWKPEMEINPLRGLRNLKFGPQGNRSVLTLEDSTGISLTTNITPESSNWYERHLVRDNLIHELIEDTHYGTSTLLNTGKETARTAAAVTWGVTVGVAGIVVGAGLIYLAAEIGSSEAAELAITGFGIALGGIAGGASIVLDSIETSKKKMNETMDTSISYRFVRFLPEYSWVGWSQQKMSTPVTLALNNQNRDSISLNDISEPVVFAHLPDPNPESSLQISKNQQHSKKLLAWQNRLFDNINSIENNETSDSSKKFKTELKKLYLKNGRKQLEYSIEIKRTAHTIIFDDTMIELKYTWGMLSEEHAMKIDLNKEELEVKPSSFKHYSKFSAGAVARAIRGFVSRKVSKN